MVWFDVPPQDCGWYWVRKKVDGAFPFVIYFVDVDGVPCCYDFFSDNLFCLRQLQDFELLVFAGPIVAPDF